MQRYKEIEHTADIGVEIYGATLEELFHNAGYALFDTIVDAETIEDLDGADLEADLGLAAQGAALAPGCHGDAREITLGGGQEILALAPALDGQVRVAADAQIVPEGERGNERQIHAVGFDNSTSVAVQDVHQRPATLCVLVADTLRECDA